MKLTKPLVFFDVETTGLDISKDRIIEISMIKIHPDGGQTKYYSKLNPQGKAIEQGAYEKHGIKLEDLEDCPTFLKEAETIKTFIEGCDLGGYNCKRFDIPILVEEFLRAGVLINVKNYKIVDVYKILSKAEPRTLEGTYMRFFGKPLEGAHGAEADIIATIEVLEELEKLYDLPDTSDEMHEYSFKDEKGLDLENKLIMNESKQITFNFGKYKGQTVQDVYKLDSGYFDWIIDKSDMTRYAKSIFRNVKAYAAKHP